MLICAVAPRGSSIRNRRSFTFVPVPKREGRR
jgi:hypothetical protein